VPDEYKALTVINLPFIEERYEPGSMIPLSAFERSAEAAEEANPDAHNPTAEENIEHLTEWGSLSDDPEAELHPAHRPVNPNQVTLAQMADQAQSLIAELEGRGEEVPAKLRALAEISDRQISTVDSALGGEAS
jgi:hypothetical protein